MTADAGFWSEASLKVPPALVEAVAELLQDLTGNGVTIEPPIEALGPDEGYILDTNAALTLRAYFAGEVGAAQIESLRSDLDQLGDGIGPVGWQRIREEDWAENWKEHYQIERVGRIVIRPAWREYTAQPNEIIVSLDPGMAFGTGQHPTTRMCLAATQELLRPGASVLDLGCGSGVLAIAALALGAGHTVAVDTEEQAVAASHTNLALNDMTGRAVVGLGSIDAVPAGETYDLILANINAATVTALAQAMADRLATGGVLVAGGIIEERQAAPLAALEAAGLRIDEVLAEGDWRSVVCRRA